MDQDQLLDIEDIPEQEVDNMRTAAKWWERKRLIYNITLLLLEGSIIIYYWKGFERFGVSVGLIQAFLYNLAANFFYCIGWGLEILLAYYIPQLKFANWLRWVLWIAGVLFSLALTYYLFSYPLYFYKYGFIYG